jgi:hypothetical protein
MCREIPSNGVITARRAVDRPSGPMVSAIA